MATKSQPVTSADRMPIMSMNGIWELLLRSVRYWDAYGTVDGSRASPTLQQIAQSRKKAVHITHDEQVCDIMRLERILFETAPPFAMLVTAVPNSVQKATLVGNTFCIVVLWSEIVVVDSHAHYSSCPTGAVRAIFRGEARRHACTRWIWDDAHGLLQSMRCQRNFVDVTAFHLVLETIDPKIIEVGEEDNLP